MEIKNENGTKFDQDKNDKPRISLLPMKALWEMAKVMSYGAEKYGDFNWKQGIRYSRLLDAAFRHLIKFTIYENLDPETAVSHLAHAGCCITMLLEMTMEREDLDDRFKPKQEKGEEK